MFCVAIFSGFSLPGDVNFSLFNEESMLFLQLCLHCHTARDSAPKRQLQLEIDFWDEVYDRYETANYLLNPILMSTFDCLDFYVKNSAMVVTHSPRGRFQQTMVCQSN